MRKCDWCGMEEGEEGDPLKEYEGEGVFHIMVCHEMFLDELMRKQSDS